MTQMMRMKIKTCVGGRRDGSFYFLLASLVLALIMLLTYITTGTNTFTPNLSDRVIGMLGGCIALGVLMAVFEVKNGKYLLYLLTLWTWLEFLVYNASYISNVLVGIDGNLFSTGFLTAAGCGLLSWAAALVAAIMQKNEVGCTVPQDAEKKAED